MLGHEVTKAYGGESHDGTIDITFEDPGTASAPSFQRYHAAGFGRRERLCRQGPFRRTPGVAAVEERTSGYIAGTTTSSAAT